MIAPETVRVPRVRRADFAHGKRKSLTRNAARGALHHDGQDRWKQAPKHEIAPLTREIERQGPEFDDDPEAIAGRAQPAAPKQQRSNQRSQESWRTRLLSMPYVIEIAVDEDRLLIIANPDEVVSVPVCVTPFV
jgi:hypothetical protein